jgi:hypothetical protein
MLFRKYFKINFKSEMVKWKKIKTFSLAAKVDFALQENCKKAIDKFCPVSSSVSIVDCLRRKLLDPGLGQMCRRVVINRIMTQNKDIRLNPSLYNACTRDISAFCAEPFLVLGQKTTDQPTNGQVILCPRATFLCKKFGKRFFFLTFYWIIYWKTCVFASLFLRTIINIFIIVIFPFILLKRNKMI